METEVEVLDPPPSKAWIPLYDLGGDGEYLTDVEVVGYGVGDHFFVHRSVQPPWTTWELTHGRSGLRIASFSRLLDAMVAGAFADNLPGCDSKDAGAVAEHYQKMGRRFRDFLLSFEFACPLDRRGGGGDV